MDGSPYTRRDIYDEVDAELEAVFEKLGEQNHPLTAPGAAQELQHNTRANMWKSFNEERVKTKRLAWDGIVLEEVFEAFAESDPAIAREELIQATAMCIATIESIDRGAR